MGAQDRAQTQLLYGTNLPGLGAAQGWAQLTFPHDLYLACSGEQCAPSPTVSTPQEMCYSPTAPHVPVCSSASAPALLHPTGIWLCRSGPGSSAPSHSTSLPSFSHSVTPLCEQWDSRHTWQRRLF